MNIELISALGITFKDIVEGTGCLSPHKGITHQKALINELLSNYLLIDLKDMIKPQTTKCNTASNPW